MTPGNDSGARPRDVIAIGASAGGVQALLTVLRKLPPTLPAAIAVVLHRPPNPLSRLASVLSVRGGLPVSEAVDGEPFAHGRVILAPPDRHLRIVHGRARLDRGPKQHHVRPAIDPLFESLAREYGPRVVGVELTGNLSDGVAGLIEIKAAGGLSIVQDPAEAQFPDMPRNALRHDHVDLVCKIARLPAVLEGLVQDGSAELALQRAGEALHVRDR
jgi:two-component system chemotaxis response regulator CheB